MQGGELAPVSGGLPLERQITDCADFTGRTTAVDSLEVGSRLRLPG
jgi:hypothetical protein